MKDPEFLVEENIVAGVVIQVGTTFSVGKVEGNQ